VERCGDKQKVEASITIPWRLVFCVRAEALEV
jgi:hypothetical protein